MIKIIQILRVDMNNSKNVDDKFDELFRKSKIECGDFVETFFDVAKINDDKIRTYNIEGLARNLIRDYTKYGRFANLPIFLENLVDIVREE